MNHTPALRLNRVTKRFDEFVAVNDLSLEVQPGKIFGLLGPNGAGKTTTIRMIVGITLPDSGSIELFGQSMNSRLQEQIGYLPEERGLYKKMRVSSQLRFFGEMKGMSGKAADKAVDYWLERLKLSEWKTHKTDELSKGMQQKIQFIATVMHEPRLLVLDEPFSGFDPVNAELLKEIVLEMRTPERAIIFSTHLMEQAEKMCDDICLINHSRKVLDGNLRAVKRGFGRDAIALRIDNDNGGASVLRDPNLVAHTIERGDYQEVTLAPEVNPQTFLHNLIHAGAHVSRFEQIEPSLNEIFISKVNETN